MKLNKIAASFALIAGMAMVSCSEGQYWDKVTPTGDIYGFAKTAETVNIPAADEFPTSYVVTVRRSEAGPELTVPVSHKADNELLSGAPTVTFPAGSLEAKYQIDIAPGGEAGINYKDVLTLAAPEGETSIKVDDTALTFTFILYHELNWVYGGTAKMSASGIFETAKGETVDVDIEVATNWPNKLEKMCRLVSPFHALDPTGVDAGHDIWFLLDDYNEPLDMYEMWQYTGCIDDEVGFLFFGTPTPLNGKFSSVDDVFTMRGSLVAASTENPAEFDTSDNWRQTLRFTWEEYDLKPDEYGK